MTTAINPMLLKSLRADIEAALVPLRAKYGLSKLNLGRGTYDPEAASFHFKLDGLGEGGKSPDAQRYEGAAFLGLPPLGFAFKSRGESFKTTGLNTTGTKVLCERSDGTVYLFKTDAIKRIAAKGGA